MSASDILSSPPPVSQSPPLGSCRLCLRQGHTKAIVSSPARRLMKCHACGVTFLDPQPVAEDITDHLTERYITEDAHVEINFGKWREAVLSRVASKVHRRIAGGRILDIGCAGGYFLYRYFSSPGWDLFGIEPSKFAAGKASQKGVKVFRGECLSVDLPAAFFDVVTIFDTLSYFRQPQRELWAIRRAMKPDGLLVIEQPYSATHVWRHATRLGHLLGGAPMSLLECGQNFLYDAPSMRLLLGQTGFMTVDFETLPGNKQRNLNRDLLFAGYFAASRLVWRLSGRNWILGPNFVVLATPLQSA